MHIGPYKSHSVVQNALFEMEHTPLLFAIKFLSFTKSPIENESIFIS